MVMKNDDLENMHWLLEAFTVKNLPYYVQEFQDSTVRFL